MIIKKAFQLTENNSEEIDVLENSNNELKAASIMLDVARRTVQEAIAKRDKLIEEILLDYEYLLSPTDKVIYNPQLYKILIYEESGTIDEAFV